MTPLAARLRDLRDRCRTKKQKAGAGLLLSYRECQAVLRLLDAAKGYLDGLSLPGDPATHRRLVDAIAALESP